MSMERRESWRATWRGVMEIVDHWRFQLANVLNPPMYVRQIGMPEVVLEPGATQGSAYHVNGPLQLIDLKLLVRVGRIEHVDVQRFFVGDDNQLQGTSCPAACFDPRTQNRFLRSVWVDGGTTITLGFVNKGEERVVLTPVPTARSYRR